MTIIGVLSIPMTIGIYMGCRRLYSKVQVPLLNPIFISIIALVIIMLISGSNYDDYNVGGQYITWILGPIVVLLAIPLYHNRKQINQYMLPIIVGISAGMMTTVVSVFTLSKILGLDQAFLNSLYSKSITTPLAIEVTKMTDGIEGLTIVSVIITGIIGATVAPVMMRIAKVDHDIAKGIGIGSSSHGIGTSKAIEMGEETAGASGLAMSITGIATVLLASLIFG